MTASQRPRSILIAAETGLAYGRGIAKGVINFAKHDRMWSILLAPYQDIVNRLATTRPDGLILQSPGADASRAVHAMGIAAVNVSDAQGDHRIPTVISDHRAVGQRAVEHLVSRGLRHLAFSGRQSDWYVAQRCQGFLDALRDAGIAEPAFVHTPGPRGFARAGLHALFMAAPRPLGILGAHDFWARGLIKGAMECGLRVPEDVAVVGVDDDELICEMCPVPLSSVAVAAERIGFEAAAILHRLLQGETVDTGPYLVPPKGVVVRQSSNTLAIEDQTVAAAIRFIRANADRPIAVEDVLDQINVSRRLLEQRFRTVLGRSPAAEIRRLRLEQAKQLLDTTDLPLTEVARRAGFTDVSFLGKSFRRHTGMTPTDYRRRTRPDPD